MEIEILYEDKEILVCYKPVGVPSQNSKGFKEDMVSMVLNYEASKHLPLYAGVITRLDEPVSGVILFAKNRKMADKLSKTDYEKEYLAVVLGSLSGKGTLENYLAKEKMTNVSYVCKSTDSNAKLSKLEYEAIKSFTHNEDVLTLVRVRLLTGRHHQIRVMMSHAGHPLYADRKYGTGVEGESVALFAREITFAHPVTKNIIKINAKPRKGILLEAVKGTIYE